MQLYKLLFLISFSFCNIANAKGIGDVAEQSGAVGNITRKNGEKFSATINADIASFDVVKTLNGRLRIKFVDDTQVSMTEHTVVEINEYVYDPNPSNSRMALNFAQGTARFATGKLGLVPKQNIAIKTPTASIGVRGTDFTMTVDELGRSLVILLPDAGCNSVVDLEQGCLPSGSITVTNQGGTVILDEAYQAVMVSTAETAPTTPVVLENLDLNMIDNMFIVSQPGPIREAVEAQQESAKVDYLAFGDLDVDFLEQNLLENNIQNLAFTELDIDYLNIDFLVNFMDILDSSIDMDPVGGEALASTSGSGQTKITGTTYWGFDAITMYNTILEEGDNKILFLRVIDGQGKISIRVPAGSNAKLETVVDPSPSTICLNDCSSINIYIRQTNG